MELKLEDFVFVTFENTDGEVKHTFVVKKDKLDDFLNDKYTFYGIGVCHINKATLYFNGSIGRGDYIKTVKVDHLW